LGLEIAYHDGRQWLSKWPKDSKDWPIAVRIRLAVLYEAGLRQRPPAGPENVWTTSRIVNFPRRPGQQEPGNE